MRRFAFLCAVGAIAACGSTAAPRPTSDAVVARVGSVTVVQSTFNDRLTAAEVAIEQAGGPTPGPSTSPMQVALENSVMQSLVLDAVVAQMAQRDGVEATDAQIAAEIAKDQKDAGGAAALATQLAEAGGSLDQLRDEIRSSLNEEHLEDYLAAQRARDVERQLAAGGGFAALARRYSDDPASAASGGDLGVLSPATLQQEDASVRTAIEGLHPGETTQPIRDSAGYEILHLVATTPAGPHVLGILIAAPQPYTVQNRPAWFAQTVLDQLRQLCAANQVVVYIKPDSAPCTPETPAATPSPAA